MQKKFKLITAAIWQNFIYNSMKYDWNIELQQPAIFILSSPIPIFVFNFFLLISEKKWSIDSLVYECCNGNFYIFFLHYIKLMTKFYLNEIIIHIELYISLMKNILLNIFHFKMKNFFWLLLLLLLTPHGAFSILFLLNFIFHEFNG